MKSTRIFAKSCVLSVIHIITQTSSATTTNTTTAPTANTTTATDSSPVGAIVGTLVAFVAAFIVLCIPVIIIIKRKKRWCFKANFMSNMRQYMNVWPQTIISRIRKPPDVTLDSTTASTSKVKLHGDRNSWSNRTYSDSEPCEYSLASRVKPEQAEVIVAQPHIGHGRSEDEYDTTRPETLPVASGIGVYNHAVLTSGQGQLDDYDVTGRCPPQRQAPGDDTYNHLRKNRKKKEKKRQRDEHAAQQPHAYENVAAKTTLNENPDGSRVGDAHDYYNI